MRSLSTGETQGASRVDQPRVLSHCRRRPIAIVVEQFLSFLDVALRHQNEMHTLAEVHNLSLHVRPQSTVIEQSTLVGSLLGGIDAVTESSVLEVVHVGANALVHIVLFLSDLGQFRADDLTFVLHDELVLLEAPKCSNASSLHLALVHLEELLVGAITKKTLQIHRLLLLDLLLRHSVGSAGDKVLGDLLLLAILRLRLVQALPLSLR